MNVGSLFSGIGGLDHGLANAGFRHVFLCESDPWRRDVLRARFPGVPVYDDVRDIARADVVIDGVPLRDEYGYFDFGRRNSRSDERGKRRERGWDRTRDPTDLLCGGFPCQDLSVAGQRRGLAGDRSGLFYEFARIAESLRPRWLLVENVPGLLSSQGGRDFGAVLGTLADLGYGLAWRVLDSRFFGVPQRRRRVFIVGALADGDPRAAAGRAGEVLAVGSRCDRHPATRSEAGEAVALPLGSSARGGRPDGGSRYDLDNDTYVVSAPVTAKWAKMNGGPAGDEVQHLAPSSVRRLTPTECERLQALPDGWTQLGATPDSRRYAGLGDAVTSSVAEWIGHRMVAVSRQAASEAVSEPERKTGACG